MIYVNKSIPVPQTPCGNSKDAGRRGEDKDTVAIATDERANNQNPHLHNYLR